MHHKVPLVPPNMQKYTRDGKRLLSLKVCPVDHCSNYQGGGREGNKSAVVSLWNFHPIPSPTAHTRTHTHTHITWLAVQICVNCKQAVPDEMRQGMKAIAICTLNLISLLWPC